VIDNITVKTDFNLSPDKKRNFVHHNTLNIIENTNILEDSVGSVGSEISLDNTTEIINKQLTAKSQPKNKNLPKLDFQKGNAENNKFESNKTNISGKPENRSDNTSALTPETKDTKKKISLKLNFNQFSFNKDKDEVAKSNSSIITNTNGLKDNTSTVKEHNPKSKSFLINLENLPKIDYNTEFMSKFEEFSPSWRNECRKLKGLNVQPSNENILKLQKE
jgi:hypothetical protein